MLTVFSYGEVLIDFIPTDDGTFTPFVGGAPANVAAAVAKLGGDSCFVGGTSEDNFGEIIRAKLVSVKVQYAEQLINSQKTAMVVVSLDKLGERSFQFYRDNTADLNVTCELLATIDWQQAGVFHFCSNTLIDDKSNFTTLFAIEQVKENEGLISFDLNLRLNLWPEHSEALLLKRVLNVAKFCDSIKFSDEELSHLCDIAKMTQQSFIELLFSMGVKLVLVTAGGGDIQILTPEFAVKVVPPAVTVCDTTAGGDSFVGGFLYQLSKYKKSAISKVLKDKQILTSSVEFAAKCGAYTVAKKGSIDALPSKNQMS